MKLAPINESLLNGEDLSWLASRHGLETAHGKTIDGTLCAAVYTNGVIKSGTILAKRTDTGKLVPFDNATSAQGQNVPYGILFTSIEVGDGLGNFVDSPAAILLHGQVYTAKLPRTSSQTGGPHANAIAGLTQIIFRG